MNNSEFKKQFPPYIRPVDSTIGWAENNIRTYESITIRQYQREGWIAALRWVLSQECAIKVDDDTTTFISPITLQKELEKLE